MLISWPNAINPSKSPAHRQPQHTRIKYVTVRIYLAAVGCFASFRLLCSARGELTHVYVPLHGSHLERVWRQLITASGNVGSSSWPRRRRFLSAHGTHCFGWLSGLHGPAQPALLRRCCVAFMLRCRCRRCGGSLQIRWGGGGGGWL